VIRNTLQEIKKNLRKKYPKPFDVSTFFRTENSEVKTFIMIKDFKKNEVAQFKYIPEDGAILTGYEYSLKYGTYYENNFPELHSTEHLPYYQQVIDLFHENAIFKELFAYEQESFKLTEDMFKSEEFCIMRLDVNNDFKQFAPNGLHISIGFQYYVNDTFVLKPRMKVNFEFDDLGSLILYYDYDTNVVHFGDVHFVDSDTFKELKNPPFKNTGPFYLTQYQMQSMFLGLLEKKVEIVFHEMDNDMVYQLMNIRKQDPICSHKELESVFNHWMSEIGVLINQKSAIVHKLDDTFEAESRAKVIENFNLVKMARI